MTNQDKRVNLLIIVPLLVTVLVVGLGVTYALFTKSVNSNKIISVASGTKYIGIYGEGKNNLQIGNTYTFTVENRGVEDSGYELYIETDSSSTIAASNVTCEITSTSKTQSTANVTADNSILITGNLKAGEQDTITIKLSGATAGIYKGKLKVRYQEYVHVETGEANTPELALGMIPVVYDEASEIWKKSDTAMGTWYDYDNQIWANAVTIKDSSKRNEYKNAIVGTPINMEDVNVFFVWIPRYSYTLGNTYGYQVDGASAPTAITPGAFDIKFVSVNKIDTGSGQYTGSTPENYFTPSSFCWGNNCDTARDRSDNQELPGIWVSKFELTGSIDDISSIPNATSLKANVSTLFNAIQSDMNGDNGLLNYGFSGNYDAHMIKNTEWGAIAYLSQSKYGKYGNKSYSGENKKVYPNMTFSPNITGCSYGGLPEAPVSSGAWTPDWGCHYTYNELGQGAGASTTGTIYGVYDMDGGSSEHVMGNYNNTKLSSGFSSMPSQKYYNLYRKTDISGIIKGDAMGTFYGNSSAFPYATYPWVIRSYNFSQAKSANIGLFSFNRTNGGNSTATRAVVIPAK